MKIRTLIGTTLLIAAGAMCPAIYGEYVLPTAADAVLLSSTATVTADDAEAGSISFPIYYPESLASVTCEYSWLHASIEGNELVFDYDANPNSNSRDCRVYFTRSGCNQTTMTFIQPGTNLAGDIAALIPSDEYVVPTSATASHALSGHPIEDSFDGDTSTYFHSNKFVEDSEDCPALEYFFDEPFILGSIKYIPLRYSGYGGNGWFGVVDIYVRPAGSDTYELALTYDFGKKSTDAVVSIPDDFTYQIDAVKLLVRSGKSGNAAFCWASCAEMQFIKCSTPRSDREIFVDDICSALNTNVTAADIENMTNPMLKRLATEMFEGRYSSVGRVSHNEAAMSPSALASYWRIATYDNYQNATGVVIGKGTSLILVSGIPDNVGTRTLRVRSWLPTKDSEQTFTIRNGVNVITRDVNWSGLVYIDNYYSRADMEAGNTATVNVHIVDGAVNGVLSNQLSNDENQRILDNACHGVMDCMGGFVHGIWETEALKTYTKGQYVCQMNIIDQLIIWIQRMIGVEKYGLCTNNKSLIFSCNYNYMTQTGTGIAMHRDTQSRLLNVNALRNTDSDAIWGLSHEFGHQHQYKPLFCWPGTWEVTNNMNSCYNGIHMGMKYDRIESARDGGIKMFLNDNHNVATSSRRQRAIEQATTGTGLDWCPVVKEIAAAQSADIASYADDPDRALSIFDVDGAYYMAMFFQLQCYFSEQIDEDYRPAEDYLPDFAADLYQAIRLTTEGTEGSNVEKNGVDKYELLACAQLGNSTKLTTFRNNYPESVWNTQKYLADSGNSQDRNLVPFVLNYVRKASLISGYNLVPYFERWGLLRAIIMYCPDYVCSYYLMPQDVLDEFRKDMSEAVDINGNPLKEVSDELIERISATPIPLYDKPDFPNDHAVTRDEIITTISK